MNPAYVNISKHLKDYLSQDKKLEPFYNASLRPDWQELAESVSVNFKQKEIVEELIAQNQPDSDPQINKNCRLLKDEKTLIIITGQQLGLMQSPLYIIYKTLTTIWLANKLNREDNGYNFVPVFWLEGEDHDFEEVKSLTLAEMSGNLKTFTLQENAVDQGKSINRRILGSDIESLLAELKETLQPTEFQDDLFEKLTAIYQPGKNWLQAFKEHMASVFINSGLLFFNAGSEKIKELSKPFFREMLENNQSIISAFAQESKVLENNGYDNQVNIQHGKSYLFFTKDGSRQALFIKDDTFHIKETEETYSRSEMIKMLEQNPQWFSSTVLSRPLWQSFLLPVVSYVAGGAEISYWAQLKSAFEQMHIVMPHLQPRHSITLLEPKTERLLKKYELEIKAIPANQETLLKDYFAHTQLGAVTDSLNDFEKQIAKSREEVKEHIKSIDPTLIKPTEKSYDSISASINKLHNRLSKTIAEKEGLIRRHLQSIHESILPAGVLQERLISPLYFENKYGPGWIEKVSEHINENFIDHLIVKL